MWQNIKNTYHLARAVVAQHINQSPASSMTVIGVTGTDGKTTTASMIYHILQKAGFPAALITTVSAKIGDKEFDTGFHVSTPDSFALQAYLKKAKDAGVTHVVLEITSHALDQHRAYGIPIEVAVLTNISRDHLDYHKTMERYMRTKAKLLQSAKIAVLNKDDESFSFMKGLLGDKTCITFGMSEGANISPKNTQLPEHIKGEFNKYNLLASIAVTKSLGIGTDAITKALRTFRLPKGRSEVVYDREFKIIIDFAHTPNGIKSLLQSLHEEKISGKILHVFGSAGARDSGKREAMGNATSTFSDITILTAEDPRGELVETINNEIRKGIAPTHEVKEIVDRQEAITYAVSNAQEGDIVVITGKGHELSMNFGNGEVPWSDYKAVTAALEMRKEHEKS
jgi:UDP-N-acetylmuramoyl-L-alanyl-D-glutamate--2,6-diaminopimelate ligase